MLQLLLPRATRSRAQIGPCQINQFGYVDASERSVCMWAHFGVSYKTTCEYVNYIVRSMLLFPLSLHWKFLYRFYVKP